MKTSNTPGTNLIFVSNSGPDIVETNYFDHANAKHGLFYASWNAGALRLLVPDSQRHMIAEMKTGSRCIVTRGVLRGVTCLEFMWDDDSDAPYCIHLDIRQSDRDIGPEPTAMQVHAWTREGIAASWPGRYRSASTLPCLAPWSEQ